MTEVRDKGTYEQWVKFFLQAVLESARDATATIDKLSELHVQNVRIIEGCGRASKTAMRLFAYLEQNPIIDIRKTATALDMAFSTTSLAVDRLCEAGVLVQSQTGSGIGHSRMNPILRFCEREPDYEMAKTGHRQNRRP
jgi:hypothetical protein